MNHGEAECRYTEYLVWWELVLEVEIISRESKDGYDRANHTVLFFIFRLPLLIRPSPLS